MSTKIYNGRITAGPIQARDLLMRLREMGVRAKTVAEDRLCDLMIGKAVERYDAATLGTWFAKTRTTALFDVVQEAMEAQAEAAGKFVRTPFDFSLTVACYPVVSGRWLLLPFCENAAVRDVFFEAGWHEEFAYRDNTDRPESFTEAQWEERASVWDEALGPHGVPAEAMFCVRLVDERLFPGSLKERFKQVLPNIETRARVQAVSMLFRCWMEQCDEGDASPARALLRYMDHLKTAEGQQELRVKVEAVRPMLDNPLTFERLNQREWAPAEHAQDDNQ